ncbi:tryptophanyl-tRNA synthetase [Cryptosporidium sp. chipmunk genotype I]|uniref:tryptophanyl-tRNA synthetase n=1 Tax=Cryptosporidium sp. chipmunk genotype I TaxID=1280935 RepID=UPI00351A8205|nr:tryptophanyl-tRNA synthetase [Cryptosporidium sp. chipmunk genotype I]
MSTKNPVLFSALCVVKGSISTLFGLSGKVSKLKFKNEKVSFNYSLSKEIEINDDTLEELNNIISYKIKENSSFQVFRILSKEATSIYGNEHLESDEVPPEDVELRIVTLRNFYLSATRNPVLKNTKDIGSVLIESISLDGENPALLVNFKVDHPLVRASEENFKDLYCEEYSVQDIKDGKFTVPSLEDSLPISINLDIIGDELVNPWEVKADNAYGIDYNKLIDKFGCKLITKDMIERMERLTGQKAHHFFRRNIFLSHRDFEKILDVYEKGELFYLYTGRGPSSESLHVGHLVPFLFTKYLQDTFKVPLVIQLTDDEKFIFKSNLTLEETHSYAYENMKDIIACGFDPELTFIFTNLEYIAELYPDILRIEKKISCSQIKSIFGFKDSCNVGKFAFPAVQAAPAFSSSFPNIFGGRTDVHCLIPHAIDQDPYFRMVRDVAPRLGYLKPSSIHSIFLPSLQGSQTKMSASVQNSSIFVNDNEEAIRSKIMKYAFSGGQATEEEQRKLGANLDVDVSWQYLRFLMEDDKKLEEIGRKYSSGEMLSGEIKSILVDELVKLTKNHQKNREAIDDSVIAKFTNKSREQLSKLFNKK